MKAHRSHPTAGLREAHPREVRAPLPHAWSAGHFLVFPRKSRYRES